MTKPVERIREGNVSASIFENDGPKGKFLTAAIQLRYKPKDGDWQTGTSYGERDLENLEKVARQARESINKSKPKTPQPK